MFADSRLFKKEVHYREYDNFIKGEFIKLLKGLCALLFISNIALASDTVKVIVGTQSYHCELGAELNCKPVNEIQQKVIQLNKNGGNIAIQDKGRGLSAEVASSINGLDISYDITLCSALSCSISTTISDASGKINQLASGQYNITQKSFDVLAFYITSQASMTNFQEKFLRSLKISK